MTDHNVTLHVTTTGENGSFEVTLPETPPPEPPKPRPSCCPETPIWWEEREHPPDHRAGWTGVANVAIQARMFWLYNPKFCPMCGTKLPEKP
jgi:hypothetical protein